MKVSVIIPTYKRSEFLIRAIESIINQTYSNIEIIVVDDNGIGLIQKETHQIVSKFPSVKLVTYKKNKGACFARNAGAQNATGADPAQLAHGISVALYNTGFGLAVAMPSLVFYRYFRAVVDGYVIDMEQQAIRFVDTVLGARHS